MTGLSAFLIFGTTMGLLVFLMSFLGASAGPRIAITLRIWGHRVQTVSSILIIIAGGLLIYSGLNPGLFNRLLLS